ncbi:MAG: lipid A deacylase LpxR family protein [Pseudomonadales bacterium]|nr:lipid A deacylase LpxR family protein [Pseudomonadales bacterium]
MKLAQRLVIVLLPVLFPTYGHAIEDPKDSWTFSLYFENDLFAETDQNYTNGVRLSWISPDLTDYIKDPTLPNWIRSVNKRLKFFHPKSRRLQRNLIFSIGQTIYTPEDIDATLIVEDDRPYAGWLFTRFAYQSKSQRQLDTLEVNIGVVGPSALGQEAQDFIHDLRGFDKFKGWDNQLDDELGLIFLYEHRRKLFRHTPHDGRFGYDFIGHAGVAFGNVATYINMGGEIRLGWLIPNDFGTSAVRPGGDNSAPGAVWDPRISAPGKIGFHFFTAFDVRAIGRDIFLDGNTFEGSHRVSKKEFVGDASIGLSTVFKGVKLSVAQVFRSKEFEQQKDAHSYGSISISFSY